MDYQAPTPATADSQDNQNRQLERRDNFRDAAPQRGGFDGGRPAQPWEQRDTGGYRGASAVKNEEQEYRTADEREAAFFKLLRSHKIKYDSEWKDVVRTVATEKGFRAIEKPRDRKEAFDKYCAEEKAADTKREQERKQKQREQFVGMLKLHDEIKHYSRWKTARRTIEDDVAFKNVPDEDERKRMFREYVVDLQKRHAKHESDRRDHAIGQLTILLQSVVVDSQMKWLEAFETLENNNQYVSNIAPAVSKYDTLRAFENHVREIDAERNDRKQKEKMNQYRGQRIARDGLKDLLNEQIQAGRLRATTRWKDFYPLIKDDVRCTAALARAGSTPLELFFDAREVEEGRLRAKRDDALDALEAQRYEMTASTTYDEFEKVMRADGRTRDLSSPDLQDIYDKLMQKVKRRQEAERALADRDHHNAVDALRSAIKHHRSIHSDDRYEDVASKIEALPEARDLDDDSRRLAFEKHIRRAQEKVQDRDKERSRRDRDRNGPRRSYDDDRDRDRRHRTRSPELDAYEEDRRRAQADRERMYRKASFGLTPPPRDRRDDRDRRDRHDRNESVYERERKEREMERERNYMSRADPRDRGKITTLDYGDDDTADSVPGSVRKRRESEASASSRRATKVCYTTISAGSIDRIASKAQSARLPACNRTR